MTLAAEIVSVRRTTPLLSDGWSCCAHPPQVVGHPDQLHDLVSEWFPSQIPGTVASALKAVSRWDFDHPLDLDASDWWFCTTFTATADEIDLAAALCFDGLATLAEVWLNGESILTTDNMFRSYRADVTSKLRLENELAIVFRSLKHELQRKRPRPCWKTGLVDQQQLRWMRTSLLGHIPGWSPPVPAIGPWRAVHLETDRVLLEDRRLRNRLEETTGVVSFEAHLTTAASIQSAELCVGEHRLPLKLDSDADGQEVSGELRIENPPLWWPHTHGEPNLLPCRISIVAEGEEYHFPCGEIGFRRLEVDTHDGGFAIRANGVPIFCRGACWTVSDILTMSGTPESLAHDLKLARDAGANMLRVGGTMVYESDDFYRLCDRLGILVWQDFMFANMDYPVQDAVFRQNIEQEAVEQLRRLAAHPCVAVYCGNSEVEQQAAMLGLPRDAWRNEWFATGLPALCAVHHPHAAYVPSTPSGASLPFHPRAGVTHYYGVGAYLRPIEDVRRSDVRFTPECLGFSNLPEDAAIEAITGGALPVTHTPRWKQRVPRDTGAGWDFEDVRDHYLRELFGVDPVALRSRDMPRYLQLGRVATGEMMAQAFSEWRSGHSRNHGALVWFYKDLWPAAGWGIVDSTGMPKAAYYALKRLWNNRQLTITDEGLNGLHLHLTNETSVECAGSVEVQLLREPNLVIAKEQISIRLTPRSKTMLTADDILGRFCDVSYAYRFGPPPHDVVLATWRDDRQQVVSDAFHFIQRRDPPRSRSVNLTATARRLDAEIYQVDLHTDSFLQSVRLQAPGYLPSDNYFHLAPGQPKSVEFRPLTACPAAFRGEVEALNLADSRRMEILVANP